MALTILVIMSYGSLWQIFHARTGTTDKANIQNYTACLAEQQRVIGQWWNRMYDLPIYEEPRHILPSSRNWLVNRNVNLNIELVLWTNSYLKERCMSIVFSVKHLMLCVRNAKFEGCEGNRKPWTYYRTRKSLKIQFCICVLYTG